MKRRLRPSFVARPVPTTRLSEPLTLARVKSGLQRLGLSLVLLIATVSGVRAQFTDWNASAGDWSKPRQLDRGRPNRESYSGNRERDLRDCYHLSSN